MSSHKFNDECCHNDEEMRFVSNLPDFPEDQGFRMKVIRREGMYAFVPESHPYYNRDVLSVEDFQGMRICIFERYAAPKMYDRIMSFFSDASVEFEEVGHTPDTPTFTLMVLLNDNRNEAIQAFLDELGGR